MDIGYYWVRQKSNLNPIIARLTKNSGWQYFDGSHVKMVPIKPAEVLMKIEELKEK
jgi:hypothetical protein